MKRSFKAYLESKSFSQKTIEGYMSETNRFIQWRARQGIEPEQTTTGDILAYIKACKRTNKQRSIQYKMVSLDHYYNHLKKEGGIEKKPTAGIEIKGVVRKQLYHILEPQELDSLYQNYPKNSPANQRDRVMLGLVVYQGLRTEEILKLEVDSIKAREGLIEVPGSRRSNSRRLKLESHQVLDIYDYLQRIRGEFTKNQTANDYLFVNTQGSSNRPLIMRNLAATMKRLYPMVSSLNQIRASVIAKWLKMYNLREVQYRAGHKYISSTEGYLQNDMGGLQEEINKYHPLG